MTLQKKNIDLVNRVGVLVDKSRSFINDRTCYQRTVKKLKKLLKMEVHNEI